VYEDADTLLQGRNILKYGAPEMGTGIRYYDNHALVYDQQKRTPFWVAEYIRPEVLTGGFKLPF